MGRILKILVLILILLLVLFFLSKFLNIKPFGTFGKTEVCPPSECTYTILESGQTAVAVPSNEEGREHKEFGEKIPAGFPPKLPIDPKPIRVVSSFSDNTPATKTEPGSLQSTYSYTTSRALTLVSSNFEKFLKSEGFTVTVNKDTTEKLTHTLTGRRTIDFDKNNQMFSSMNVTIVTQNQFESLVTISMLVSEIRKNI